MKQLYLTEDTVLISDDMDVSIDLDEMGDAGNFYRYLDFTTQAEKLIECIKLTVDHELV